jgi:diguanylate cyclase (GGDEF)-like protein/PAS domain S-box-containing protein
MTATTPTDESARLAALRERHLMDTPPEETYDELTRLAAYVCGAPIAAVTLIDSDRQWFKSILGASLRETSRRNAFCAHTILQDDIMVVPDTRNDPRFMDNPQVTGDMGIRFYAGAPLLTDDGHALGALCVLDTTPRDLTEDQQTALRTIARTVVAQMELNRRLIDRERLALILEATEDGVWEWRPETGETFFSVQWKRMLGYEDHEMPSISTEWERRIHPDDVAIAKAAFHANFSSPNATTHVEYRIRHRDGSWRWWHSRGRASHDTDGNVMRAVGTNTDITAYRQARADLMESEARKGAMLEAALDCIITIDAEERVLEWNPAAERTFGYSRDEAMGQPLSNLIIPEGMRMAHEVGIAHFHATGEGPVLSKRVEVPGVRKDGTELPLELTAVPIQVGGRTMFTAYLRDLTERRRLEAEREAALREAQDRADRDPLTGLLNHRAFHKRLEEEAERIPQGGPSLTVVMMDLDNFKFFNDVYGHTVGDDVLRRVAGRLQSICDIGDCIARFGGDEFALLISGDASETAEDFEARLRTGLGDIVFSPSGQSMDIPITVSFGVAQLGRFDADWREAVHQADERLRRAKTGGADGAQADRVRTLMSGRVEGFSMLDALVTSVDNKDRYTRRHSEDVMLYSMMIAEELGLSEADRQTVAVSALLHDVGKIGIPDAILRKPGKLTAEEFEAIQQHPMMGSIMVSAAHGLEETLDAVRHHHERWDGGGYPFGLKGEECPLIARLMAVADAFSAMTTDRPYRKGMPRSKATEILTEGGGTQWDPQCVQAFLSALKREAKRAAA